MSAVTPYLPGAEVLDLYAGSGGLGLEALSRGAERAVFVENAPAALRTLRSNIALLGAGERAEVVRSDVLRYVNGVQRGVFEVVFADPPYGTGAAQALAEAFLASPFAEILTLEHGPADRIPEAPGIQTRRYGDTRLSLIPAPT